MVSIIILFIIGGLVGDGIGAKCPSGEPITKRGLSAADKQAVIDAHNKVRLDIANGRVSGQPKGIDLKRMVYDDKLGEKAKAVSDTCEMNHIKIKDSRWSAVGQNLYISWSSADDKGKADWDAPVQAWFKEHKDFKYPNKNKNNKVVGHYTQVVWATSKHLGCDFAYYKDLKNNMFAKLYTCNYGPAGNYANQAPYKTGSSGCSKLC